MRFSLPTTPDGRRRVAKAFRKMNKARLLAGLPLLVLFLPQDAFAQAVADLVSVNGIEGVRSATTLPDGSVEIVLENGTTIVVPAESVQVLANGDILVGQDVVASIGDAVVSGAGGGGALGGLGGSGVGAAGLGGLAGLGALGGGGAAAAAVGAATVVTSGFVVDGYVAGATVFRDLNDNGQLDVGEPNVLTDERGEFTGLEVDPSNPDAKILSTGGIDIASGQPFTGTLSAPADSTVITPLTTLVQALVEADPTLSSQQAATQLANTLGLSSDTDLLNDDPVADAEGGDASSLQAAVQVANVINLAAAGSEGDSADASEAAAAALAAAISNAGSDAPLTDPTALEDVLDDVVGDARAQDIADAASSANEVVDNSGNGAEALIRIEQVLTVVQGDLVQAVESGESVGDTDVAAEAAAVVPLRPTLDRGATELNANDKAAGITFSGTGRPGTEVTVDFGGAAKSTTVAADGTWSIGYASGEFPQDPAGGTVEVRATAKASADSPASPAATRTIALDSTAPGAVANVSVASDDTINSVEAAAGFAVTGTGEAGTTVTVTIVGLPTQTATVAQDGTWSVTYNGWTGADGAGTGTVDIVDALGNDGPTTQIAFNVDTAATAQPVLDTPIAGDGTINADEAAAGVSISGTAEAGSSVTVTLGDASKTTQAGAGDGRFSVDFAPGEIPADGSVAVTAVATDAVGNASDAASVLIDIDRAPPGAPKINRITDDNVLNADELNTELVLSGTVDAGSTVSVTINGIQKAATVTGGTWTVTYAANELGADGPVAISAIATSGTGNVATSSRTFILDTSTPEPQLNPISGGTINAADAANGFQVSGTAEAGAQVTVALANGGQKVVTAAADGSFTANFTQQDLPAAQGQVGVTAQAVDAAGNTSSVGTTTFTLDSAAPTAPAINPVSGGTINRSEALNGVEVTGTAEAGSTVAVTFGDVTKSVTAATDGTWSAQFASSELPADGTDVAVSATATDAAGNTSAAGTTTVNVDTSAPGKPTINAVATDDTVSSAEKSAGITVTGTAEANATVKVRIGTTEKEPVAGQDGTWTATFAAGELPADGNRTVTAQTVDEAGNASTATNRDVVFDTTTPAPTIDPIGSVTLDVVSAAEKTAGVTITGSAEAGATVTVTVESVNKQATADANGAWSVTYASGDLPTDGGYDVTASAVDTAGNSSATATRSINIDSQAPGAPAIDEFNNASGTSTVNSEIADAPVNVLSGTAETGATVAASIEFQDGTVLDLGTTTAGNNGVWEITVPVGGFLGHAQGDFTISATATDAAGNTSPTGTLTALLDTTPPAQPTVASVTDDDVIGEAEAQAGVEVSGTAAGATTVEVTFGSNNPVTTGVVNGAYSVTIPLGAIPGDGQIEVSVVAIDDNGNRSDPGTRSVTIETQAPAAPTIDAFNAGSGTSVVNSEIANATDNVLGGSAEAGATVNVTITFQDGATLDLAAAVADQNGTWETPVPVGALLNRAQGDVTVTATATDAAGNVSPAGTLQALLDTVPPGAPTIEDFDGDIGNVVNAQVAAASDNSVSGTAEAGSTVTVTITFSDGAVLALDPVVAGETGAWDAPVPSGALLNRAQGNVTISATATDAAGNTSTAGTLSALVDTTPPAAPVIGTVAGDDVIGFAEAQSPVEIGVTAPGATTVEVTIDGVQGTFDAVLSNGVFTASIPAASLPDDGTGITVSAFAIDQYGNRSVAGTRDIDIQTQAPGTPTIAAIATDDVINGSEADAGVEISGTAAANTTVTVTFRGTGTSSTTTADANGDWTVTVVKAGLPADSATPYTVDVVATDGAGNASPTGSRQVTIDTTAPSAPGINSVGTNNDNVVNAAAAASPESLDGTGEVGATIDVTVTFADGKVVQKQTVVAEGGTWSVPVTTADIGGDGVASIRAVATDSAGNESPTALLNFTLDTQAPNAPTIAPVDGDNTVNATDAADGITVSGTAPTDAAQVRVSFGADTETVAVNNGSYTATFNGPFTDGAASVSAIAIDAAGNESGATNQAFTIDTSAISAPSIDTFNDGSGTSVVNSAIADAANNVVSGTAGAGLDVVVTITFQDGTDLALGSTTADQTGVWEIAVPVGGLQNKPQGAFTISAIASDDAGNTSQPGTLNALLDTVAPSAPGINPVDGDDTVNASDAADGITVSGTAAGAVEVRVSFGAQSETVAVTNGAFSTTFNGPFPDGAASVSAIAIDENGNESSQTDRAFTIDTSAVAAPSIGAVSTDDLLNATEAGSDLVITGTAPANTSVEVTFDGGTPITVQANGGGAWTATIPAASLPSGASETVTVSAVAEDGAGNRSSATTRDLTFDTVNPTVTLSALTEGAEINDAERAAGVDVSGSTQAGSTVTVVMTLDDTSTVQKVVTADGNGDFTATFAQGELPTSGGVSFAASAVDPAGNAGGASAPVAATVVLAPVDTTPPSAPTVDPFGLNDSNTLNAAAAANPTPLTGTGEPGATISGTATFSDGATLSKQTTVLGDGTWSIPITSGEIGVDGAASLSVTARDAAGNTSTATVVNFLIDTQPPNAPTFDAGSATLTSNGIDQVEISGNAEPGATVTLSSALFSADFTTVSQQQVQADGTTGNWSVTVDLSLAPDDDYTITAVATDAVGNSSGAANATRTVDLVPEPTQQITLDNGSVDGDLVRVYAQGFDGFAQGSSSFINGSVTNVPTGTTVTATFTPGQGAANTAPLTFNASTDANGAFSIEVPNSNFSDIDGMVKAGTLVITVDGSSATINQGLLVNSQVGAANSTKFELGTKIIDPVADVLQVVPQGAQVAIGTSELQSTDLQVFVMNVTATWEDGFDFKVIVAYAKDSEDPIPAEFITLDGTAGLGTPGAPGTDFPALTSVPAVFNDTLFIAQPGLSGDLTNGIQHDADALYTIYTIPAASVADAIPGPLNNTPPATNLNFGAAGITSRIVKLEDVDPTWTPGDTLPLNIIYIASDYSNPDGTFVGIVERQNLAGGTEEVFLFKMNLNTGATESVKLALSGVTLDNNGTIELDEFKINQAIQFDQQTGRYTSLQFDRADGNGTVSYDYSGGAFALTSVAGDDSNDLIRASGVPEVIDGGSRSDPNGATDDDVILLDNMDGTEGVLNAAIVAPVAPDTHETIKISVNTGALTGFLSGASGVVDLVARVTVTGDIAFVSNSLGFESPLITAAQSFLPGQSLPDGTVVTGVDIIDVRTFAISVSLDTAQLPSPGSFGPTDTTDLASFGVTIFLRATH